jgi:hypothetical protein
VVGPQHALGWREARRLAGGVALGEDAGSADGARLESAGCTAATDGSEGASPVRGEARLLVHRRFPQLVIPARWLVGGERGTTVGEQGSSLVTGHWIQEGGERGRRLDSLSSSRE